MSPIIGDEYVDHDRLHQMGAPVVSFDVHRRTSLPALRPLGSPDDKRQHVRLLIVDDNEDDLAVVHQLLARSPNCCFETVAERTVEAALRRIAADKFDACLVNHHLPGRHGLDLVRLAQRRGFSLPMILMSGFAEDDIDIEAMEFGAADFLDKEELDTGRLERCIRFALTRHNSSEQTDRLAQYDLLTGVANRTLFQDRLDRALAAARRHKTLVAVMVLDLNNFKPINDDLGHAVGDHVLRTIADRLTDRLRETDTVARLGGDEFAILIENLKQTDHAALVAGKVLEILDMPVEVERLRAKVSAALGVSLYPQDGHDATELLRRAESAMHRAKNEGGTCCRFHKPSLDRHVDQRLVLHGELKRALDHDEIEIRFLPQLSLRGPVLALSARPQWRHPKHGPIGSNRLVAYAEEAGIVEPLTRWMIETAISQLREWRHLGVAKLHVTIPILTHRQLAWSGLAGHTPQCLESHNLSPQAIEFELSEGLILRELADQGTTLAALKEAGLRVALTGFGDGVISLAALRDAPIDTLIIGSRLLRDVPRDTHRTLFVDAIAQLARHLKLRIVVDVAGETPLVRTLKHTGCDAVQGMPCDTPIPAELCQDWLRAARLRWQPHAFQGATSRPRL